jgi:hypothetical protein
MSQRNLAPTTITLREYIDRVLEERDKRYAAAFLAQERAVEAAFLASEKAIVKAEIAQAAYNERSNEFRAALDDQAKLFIPRTEMNIQTQELRNLIAALTSQIVALQRGESADEGSSRAAETNKTQIQWLIGSLLILGGTILTVYLAIKK